MYYLGGCGFKATQEQTSNIQKAMILYHSNYTLGDFFAGDLVTPEDGLFNILSRSNQDFHGLTEPIGSPYQERSFITSGCGLFATVLFEVVRTTKLHCSFG